MGQTPRGDELVMTAAAVEDLLAKTEKSMIIEVQIDRSFDQDSYGYERKRQRKKFNGKKHEIIVWSQGGERTLFRTHI
jgi:DNA-binding transcriptional regulator LsrR (DeoR family)